MIDFLKRPFDHVLRHSRKAVAFWRLALAGRSAPMVETGVSRILCRFAPIFNYDDLSYFVTHPILLILLLGLPG